MSHGADGDYERHLRWRDCLVKGGGKGELSRRGAFFDRGMVKSTHPGAKFTIGKVPLNKNEVLMKPPGGKK